MDKGALDVLLPRQLQDLGVLAKFINFILNVCVELFGIPLFEEVNDTGGYGTARCMCRDI